MRKTKKCALFLIFTVMMTGLAVLIPADHIETHAMTTPVCCNGKHTAACYEYGTALHQHTDAKGKTTTAATQSKRGGCYTVYNPGYSYSVECGGRLVRTGTTSGYSRSSYTCDCIDNLEYLMYGGVGVTRTTRTDVIYEDDGYTEVWTGECTRCGATAYIFSKRVYYYECTMCGLGTEHPEWNTPHYNTKSQPAYYSTGCGKSTAVYYYDNGNGREAKPVCGKTVIGLVPEMQEQTLSLEHPEPLTRATVYYLDGNSETVLCTVKGFSVDCVNEWQETEFSYGEYRFDSSKGRPVKGAYSTKVPIYIQGSGTLTVKGSNPYAGRPEAEGLGKTAEIAAGTKVVLKGAPREGYHVAAWTFSDGKEDHYSTEQMDVTDIEIIMPAYDLEACCLYEANRYKVIFDAGAGGFEDGTKRREVYVSYGQVYGMTYTPVMDGMIFDGWRLYDESSGELCDSIINAATDTVQTAYDHVLVAEWTETGPAWFYAAYDDDFPELFRPAMTGYRFEGWFFEERPCNDGKGLQITYGTPVKYEYLYNGEYIKKNRNDYVIYAGWEPKVFTVTFVCGEDVYIDNERMITGAHDSLVEYDTVAGKGKWTDRARKKVMYDMYYSELPEAVMLDDDGVPKTDAVFVGWSTTGDTDGLILPDMTVEIVHDITVYPVFSTSSEVNVTLDMNGGKADKAFSDGTRQNPFKAVVGKVYGDTLGFLPTYGGHTFKGWNLYADGSGKATINTTTRVLSDKDHTLYAKWEHYVLYSANDRDVDGNPINTRAVGATSRNTFVNDDTTPQSVRKNGFFRAGHTFLGWNTERDGSGTWYVNEDEMFYCPADVYMTVVGGDINETVTLYAQWENRIEIFLDDRGGDSVDTDGRKIVSRYGGTLPEYVEVPVKYGYTFEGYYTGTRGSGEKVYDSSGEYCYEGTVEKHDGRVALIEENYALLGSVDPPLKPYTAVSWSMMERLYACWKYSYEADASDLGIDLKLTNDLYDVSAAIPSTENMLVIGTMPVKYGVFTSEDQKLIFLTDENTVFQFEDPETERLYFLDGEGRQTRPEGKKVIPLKCQGTFDMTEVTGITIHASYGDRELFETEEIEIDENTSNVRGIVIPYIMSPNGAYNLSFEVSTGTGKLFYVKSDEIVVIHDPAAAAAVVRTDPENSLVSAESELVTGVTVDIENMTGSDTVVLNKKFNKVTVEFSHTGVHIPAKGYGDGDYRYSKSGALLTGREYVVFPFDVWLEGADGLEKREAGSEIEVSEDSLPVYIADDAPCGDHIFHYYVRAVNYSEKGLYGDGVNKDPSEYGAVCAVKLTVIPDIVSYGVDKINNDMIKNFDDEGVPVMYFGNKADFFVNITGNGNSGYKVTAVPSVMLVKNGNPSEGYVFVTIGIDEKVKAFVDIFDENGKVVFDPGGRGSFVMPYLSYCVMPENIDEMNTEASRNTLKGDEWFFEQECDVMLFFEIYAEDMNGNVIKGKRPIGLRVKRPG